MPPSPVPPRAAPPPFSRQSARSRLILAGLVLAMAGVVAVGTFVTVPTHVRAAADVVPPARCTALGLPSGSGGCASIRLDPRWHDRLGPRVPARLVGSNGSIVPVEMSGTTAARDAPTLAGPLASAPGPGPVTAVLEVGRRPLALVFLGRGLEAQQ